MHCVCYRSSINEAVLLGNARCLIVFIVTCVLLQVTETETPSVVLSDLIPYTMYTVQVRSKSKFGGYWSGYHATTDRTLPSGY